MARAARRGPGGYYSYEKVERALGMDVDLGGFLMTRKVLLGLRDRAEGTLARR